MSDFAQGYIVQGAARTKVQKWLASRRLPAFLTAGPGKVLRVWPRVEGADAEEAATALTADLPKSRVLVFSTSEAGLRVSVHGDGKCLAREEVALRLKTAKLLSQAHAALQRVAEALDYPGRLPALLRDGASRPVFLSLVAVKDEDVALLHHRLLADARPRPDAPDAARYQDFAFVDEAGKAHAFFDAKAAAPRDVDLRACVSFRDWLDTSRRLEPGQATPEVVAVLAEAVGGPFHFEVTTEQEQTLREAAAKLLGEVARARKEAREDIRRQALEGLRAAKAPGTRAAWARVLQAVAPTESEKEALAAALKAETDLEVLRQLFLAHAHLPPEATDEVLLGHARSPAAHERKGAYALLERTESTAAVVELRARLASEEDASAREVLDRVVTTLTSL
ncbi:hypothetical protein P2318_07680 [Myxococcaceae bacterium GXIMD 01537]